jgi:hypothetical protein
VHFVALHYIVVLQSTAQKTNADFTVHTDLSFMYLLTGGQTDQITQQVSGSDFM